VNYVHTVVQHSTPGQHIAFFKKNDRTLYYQHTLGVGFTSDPERALVRGVSSKASVTIGADDAYGYGFVAFYHARHDNIWFVRCQDTSCSKWSTVQNIDQGTGITGTARNFGSYLSMSLVGSQVYLSYYWVGSSALRAMFCPSVDADYDKCYAFTVEDPGVVQVGKYSSIAVNEKLNKFYISYYD